MLPLLTRQASLVVVDEAHCISDWGHDFRPGYRRIAHILRTLGERVPVLGTTATANARVVADVAEQLGGYRTSRLTSTVSTTEATTENTIMSRHPGQPPNGRI